MSSRAAAPESPPGDQLPSRARGRTPVEQSLLSLSGRLAPLTALALGLGSAFAFEPVGWWPLMPLAFILLCELIRRAPSLPRALLAGWCFGLGQFVLGLNWIATAFTYQAAMPAWLGWVAVVLLSLYLAIYPALATGLAWRFGRHSRAALVLALAAGWALTEYLRATMFTGFAWNPVGVTLIDGGYAELAPWVGTYGLSAFLVLLSGAFWNLLTLGGRNRPAAIALLAVALAPTFVPAIPLAPAAQRPSVRIVQPNIGQEDKWRPGLDQEAFARLEALSSTPSAAPRLLLWPEVAVPVPFQIIEADGRPSPTVLPAVSRAIRSIGPNDLLVTGAFALAADRQGMVRGSTNSVMVIDDRGRILGRYDKAHLVPYGEYLPMRPLLSAIGLSQLAPGIGDTLPGTGPQTLALPGFGRVGLQICYEIIFSGQVVDRANRPDFIFNPSNDAWFGPWGPPQHLAQARLRAAEEGLPVLRSTPTGISALIDAHGRLVASQPLGAAGVVDGTVPPPASQPTFFARHGNAVPLLLAALLLIIAIGIDARRRYRRVI